MSDSYQIDLEKYDLQKFKSSLQSRDMIPSRKSLKDELDVRFRILEERGITNLKELIDALKTKDRKIFSRNAIIKRVSYLAKQRSEKLLIKANSIG